MLKRAFKVLPSAFLVCALACTTYITSLETMLPSGAATDKAYADTIASGTWGTCKWDITDGTLTIHAGAGKNIPFDERTCVPWYDDRESIEEVVISENVVAPKDISYMFHDMTNLTTADLTGLDTSQVVGVSSVFGHCSNLTRIKIGPKTFAKNIFTGLVLISGIERTIDLKLFISENENYGPFSAAECATAITQSNTGWYKIINVGIWGTCPWYIKDGTLTIWAGTGKDITTNTAVSSSAPLGIPWYEHRNSIKEIVVREQVTAPAYVSYMFSNLTNLISADLSGLDTSNVASTNNVFADCPNLTEINVGLKTFAVNVFGNLKGIALVPQSGGDPILPIDLPTAINAGNTGWYNVVDAD